MYTRPNKQCAACKKIKPYKEFIWKKFESDYCTSCRKLKKCIYCDSSKPIYEFYKNGKEKNYCLYCNEKKRCIRCGHLRSRYLFIHQKDDRNHQRYNEPQFYRSKKGYESAICISCIDNVNICDNCGEVIDSNNYFENEFGKFCTKCQNTKICKCCSKIKHLYQFNDNNEICNYCSEKKKCENCKEFKYRFLFFKDGNEQKYCNKCIKTLK